MERRTVADWLESLRRDGVATVDADVMLDVERLLAVWATGVEVEVEVAAAALAARLATSVEQYRTVRQSFVEAFGSAVGEAEGRGGGGGASRGEGGGASEGGGGGVRTGWVLGLVGGIGGIGGIGWWWWRREPEAPPSPIEGELVGTTGTDVAGSDDTTTTTSVTSTNSGSEDATSSDSGDEVVLIEAAHEVPFYEPRWSASSVTSKLGTGMLAALLVVLGLRWLLAKPERDGLVAKALAARKRAVEHEDAEPGELYRFRAPPPLDPSSIDAAGDLLSRPGHDEDGTQLDVPRTLDRTVRAGGRPQPRFLRARRPPPLVVLVDVEELGLEGRAHPMAHAIEWILQRWQQTGLRFERFDYVGTRPLEVRMPGSAHAFSLSTLVRRHGGARLLVGSRLRRLRGEALAQWLAALRPWERRAWIDLDPSFAVDLARSEYGREAAALERLAEVERSGLARYPLTRQGLLAAARYVLAERGRPPPVTDEVVAHPGDAPQHERVEQALQQWATAACCVPDPAWPHLDVLRTLLPDVRRVIPEARGVWWLLRWLERKGLVESAAGARDRLALKTGAEVQLLAKEQRITVGGGESTVQQWITQRLEQQLHDGAASRSGVAGTLEQEEREARLMYYLCQRDLSAGVKGLAKLLGTTADPLVRRFLRQLMHRIDSGELATGVDKRKARAWVSAALGERVSVGEALGRVPARWEVAMAVLGIAGLFLVWGKETGARVAPAVYEVRVAADEKSEVEGPVPNAPVMARSEPLPVEETVPLELPRKARPMRLVRVNAGTFWMGSAEDELNHQSDEQRHRVTLTRPFMMCETEVTQAQWMAVMGKNPSRCTYGCGDDVPVHDVSWVMAVEYLNTLSRKQGLAECYSNAGDGWTWEHQCEGYRLPTEAEWELAARAGRDTAYSFGGDSTKLEEHAWFNANSREEAHPVALKKPNPWGLYDVHGNVWEWVWDRYERDYDLSESTNPTGPKDSEYRVLRGGAFASDAPGARTAIRNSGTPNLTNRFLGLRCVRGSIEIH